MGFINRNTKEFKNINTLEMVKFVSWSKLGFGSLVWFPNNSAYFSLQYDGKCPIQILISILNLSV